MDKDSQNDEGKSQLPLESDQSRGCLETPADVKILRTRLISGRLNLVNCATTLVVVASLVLGGYSFVKIAGICALIFATGVATMELFLPSCFDLRSGSRLLNNPAFLAVGIGPAAVLVATMVLRLVGLYTPLAMYLSLLGFVAVVLGARPRLRARCRIPSQVMPSCFYVWLACSVAYAVIVAPQIDPFTNGSSTYLTQGFDLFLDKNPSEWPYFGEKFLMPMMFATHAIGANMALFSTGDAFEFYGFGMHWLNVIVSPVIPIGAYLTFRRRLPSWAAAIAGVMFCVLVLDTRVWSLRGESLGWVLGFPFLMGFDDLLALIKADGEKRAVRRLAALLSPLYFAISLTHGIVALLVTLMAAGMSLDFLLSCRQWRAFRALVIASVSFVLVTVVLTTAYMPAFSGSVKTMFFNYDRIPLAGEPDSALQFENAISGFHEEEMAVVKTSPYFPTLVSAEASAFIPVSQIYRSDIHFIKIDNYYYNVLSELNKISKNEKIAYVTILLCFLLLYIRDAWIGVKYRRYGMFILCVFVYGTLILFSIYMNASSVSTFPVAATRRTFVYIRYFYEMAIIVAAVDYIILPFSRRLMGNVYSNWPPSVGISAVFVKLFNQAGPLALLLFFVNMLYVNLVALNIKEYSDGITWMTRLREISLSTVNNIYPLESIYLYFSDTFNRRKVIFNHSVAPEFFGVSQYIRDHTTQGDWVYSNVISDCQFWYLTDGRYALTEGSAMYQVYSLQQRAADHLKVFADVAKTGDITLVNDYSIRYFVLYKQNICDSECYGYAVYGADVDAFAARSDLVKVYENGNYVIFRRVNFEDIPVAHSSKETSVVPINDDVPQSDIRGIKGWVETAVYMDGRYQIDGWAVSPSGRPPLEIDTYVGGKIVDRTKTEISRPDIDRALGILAGHPGFHITLDASLFKGDPATQQVHFFARTENGHIQELERDPDKTLLLPALSPDKNLIELATDVPINIGKASELPVSNTTAIKGWVESAISRKDGYQLLGWAVDPDAPSSLTIRVYLGNYLLQTAETNLQRPDVSTYFKKATGLAGFNIRIPAELVSSAQRKRLRIFAFDDAGRVQELGCQPGQCGFGEMSSNVEGGEPAPMSVTALREVDEGATWGTFEINHRMRPSEEKSWRIPSNTAEIKGWVEFAVSSKNNYEITGWAVNVDDPKPMQIQVYLGNFLIGAAKTRLMRVDVDNDLKKSVGLPGFKFRIPAALIPLGTQNEVHFIAVAENGVSQVLQCNPEHCVFTANSSNLH